MAAVGLALCAACARPAPSDEGDDESEDTTGGEEESGGECVGEWEVISETAYNLQVSWARGDDYIVAGPQQLVGYIDGEWRTADLPFSWEPHAVWATGWDDVWMLDGREFDIVRRLLHWDGQELEVVLEYGDFTKDLRAIWGTGSDDIWVAGRQNCGFDPEEPCEALLLRYDGTEWVEENLSGLPGLVSVWGRNSTDVFLGGHEGTVLHFDGMSWDAEDLGDVPIRHLVGDASQAYAYDGAQLFHRTGDEWELVGDPAWLGDVLGMVMVDGSLWTAEWSVETPRVSRYDGDDWISYVLPDLDARTLASVGGEPWLAAHARPNDAAATIINLLGDGTFESVWLDHTVTNPGALVGDRIDDVWAVGTTTGGQGIAQLNGADWVWSLAPTLGLSMFHLHQDPTAGLWVAGVGTDQGGNDGKVLWRVVDGALESFGFPPGTEQGSVYVQVSDDGDVWMVALSGWIWHFRDGTWTRVGEMSGHQLETVGAHIYMSNGEFLFELLNGQWQVVYQTKGWISRWTAPDPLSLWVADQDEQGNDWVREWDGSEWTAWDLGDRRLCDFDAATPDSVYVSARHTDEFSGETSFMILSYDGEEWASWESPSEECASVHATEDGVILIDSTATYVRRCDG